MMISFTLTFCFRKFFIVLMSLNNDTKNMMTARQNISGICQKKEDTIILKNIKKNLRISFLQDFFGRYFLILKIIPNADSINVSGKPNSKNTVTTLSQNRGDHFWFSSINRYSIFAGSGKIISLSTTPTIIRKMRT